MSLRRSPCYHVMVVRLSAMGDVAMCVPVVARLREDYPDLRITVLTRERFTEFFRDIERVEFVIPDLRGRHKGFLGIWRLGRDILSGDVDAVADLHDVLRTKLLRFILRFSGVRVAVIDKGRLDKRALTRKFRKIFTPLLPTVERYRDVFIRLGFKLGALVPPLHNPRPLQGRVADFAGPKQGAWVGVAPFAQHAGKVYPVVLADSLISLLAERYERVFIFGGGRHENDFAVCMQERYDSVKSAIGLFSLGEEMDLISNLECVVTMDSATMHIASIVGTPVVSIWGATHPYAGFYGFGQRPEDAVQLDMKCRPCSVYGNKPCMYRDYRCLGGIAPEIILSKVVEVVERGAK